MMVYFNLSVCEIIDSHDSIQSAWIVIVSHDSIQAA